jgi:hypothetical protein
MKEYYILEQKLQKAKDKEYVERLENTYDTTKNMIELLDREIKKEK